MPMIAVATEEGEHFSIDCDLSMELENVCALLEVDSGIPVSDQLLFFSGRHLTELQNSLESYGVKEGDLLLLRKKSADSGAAEVAGRNIEAEAETMRRQVIGDPRLMAELRRSNPDLANAAQNDPARFRDLLHQLAAMQNSARLQQERERELLEADPYDPDAQRKIEEAIRQERVLQNFEQAMEDMPEAFGQVHMLYVDTEVNGVPVKAFVDSGAQSTIMSPACAERCGIMRLLDTRFAGMARGVGTGKILGRVHSAQLKMGGDLFLQCSFTILDSDVELLFGLDMLRRYQCAIDLKANALVIQGRNIPFLAEHELPKGRIEEFELDADGNPVPSGSAASLSNAAAAASSSSASASTSASTSTFPGSGRTLGVPPSDLPAPKRAKSGTPPPIAGASSSGPTASASPNAPSGLSEEAINSLVNLGADRTTAVRLLEAAGGNAEVAASLLFSG
ncbi:Ddi1p [Rhodotorula paludigena]|uniref:Ddi1p n=1 Tax=Rhodotorula paludigena TaxID=86838 RepID=UPI003172C5FE